jgi:septal ring factor EnvC (AmiA/AmiB activator)
LPFPTDGHIEVGFGKVLNPKFNTVTSQNGLDLRAPEGSEVRAVGPGVIVHASPFRGYGNLVIVDHGEGYHTLYAHLSVISRTVGESVEAGQVIGRVGDTGSLKGAYLYFELRKKGKPIDPKDWLGASR